jgi:hypothetical protein
VAANSSFWGVVDDLRRLETKVRVKFDEVHGRAGDQEVNFSRKKKADEIAKDLKAVVAARLDFPSKSHYLKRLGQPRRISPESASFSCQNNSDLSKFLVHEVILSKILSNLGQFYKF